MSGVEKNAEAPDRRWRYLLFTAALCETIALKVNLFNLNIIYRKKLFFADFESINLKVNCGVVIIQQQDRFLSFAFN
jgi:hypothetical protein